MLGIATDNMEEYAELRQELELIRAESTKKDQLLKEVHHRVKNNLQIISSLMYLQGKRTPEIETKEFFRKTQGHIKSMALVHEHLYHKEALAKISLATYFRDLLHYFLASYGNSKIKLEIDCEQIFLDLDTTIPLGLLITEITTNSVKHAFEFKENGIISIQGTKVEGGNLHLIIKDDGVGLGKEHYDFKARGMRMINDLSYQLSAVLKVSGDNGTKYELVFPI